MAIIDHINCGKVIVFNTMFFKLRWAFCIDYNNDKQIVYRGLFGLKCLDKKTFLGFARIVDIFDYVDRPLTASECNRLRKMYSIAMKDNKNVKDFVHKLYNEAKIDFFINPENGWVKNNELKNSSRKT